MDICRYMYQTEKVLRCLIRFVMRMTCVSVVGYWGCYDPGPEASADD